ncbi:YkgJ family cysteine cluster protein [Arcobacter sp. CECT 8985]|uniref:YkgJ family cysteine cluster protein n=1 Tax=Arcobacter sp. CECT 8985 TaxID=1935424 RepID=UPI00100C1DB3|nr:YkgJ family cysteine cluster protein [Arcobacter sp. CECT 8985]RXJ86801.1 zinc/iron-chelating domain-containing protein [Arcobacter sp. CECT 8985]
MKTFEKVENKTYYFSSCDSCEALCCDGREGSLFAQIILEDFEEVYKNFPIVFILGELGFLKPVILLTNGKSLCQYNKDFKCTIYDQRPSICKNYPLSPHLDNSIYIDKTCPATKQRGETIVKNFNINKNLNTYDFDNYQDKYIKTHFHFDKYKNLDNLEKIITLNAVDFYSIKTNSNDYYIDLHHKSLKNINNYYII